MSKPTNIRSKPGMVVIYDVGCIQSLIRLRSGQGQNEPRRQSDHLDGG